MASPAIYAVVTVGDKVILDKTGIRLSPFLLFIGVSQGIAAAVILSITGLPDVSFAALAGSYVGGLIWSVALMLLFFTLKREDVSRVTPVWQMSPIFAALFAVAILGERVSGTDWLAISLVVSGASLLTFQKSPEVAGGIGRGLVFKRPLIVVLGGAIIIGLAQNFLKIGADELTVWENLGVRAAGLATGMIISFGRIRNFTDLVRFLLSGRWGGALLISEGMGPFIGNVFLLQALSLGAVSLVSAVLGTRPIFVLALVLLMARFAYGTLPENMSRGEIALKTVSTVAIVVGVTIIALY